jgi:uncharacterized protein (DUF2384 family)
MSTETAYANAVAEVVELLSEIYDDEGVEIWLQGRNKCLGNRRPIDLMDEGDFQPVRMAVERLASGSM